jgi:hypothetical protein
MPIVSNELSTKIIEKIMNANSQEDVKHLLDFTIDSFKENINATNSLNAFVHKTIDELDQLSPMNKNAQQWSNIRFSKVILNRILF